MSTTPRPALVHLGLVLAAAPLAYNTSVYLYKELHSAPDPLDALLDLPHRGYYLYVFVLCVAILASGAVARRGGLAGALIARAGWIQGLAFCAVSLLVKLSFALEQFGLEGWTLAGLLLAWSPMVVGFALALRFVAPLTLEQTPLRIIPPRLRSALALSTLMMLTELHYLLFAVLYDGWSMAHVPLLLLAGGIIVSFGAIVRGRRWGFVLHAVNLALIACIVLASLFGLETLFSDLAPLLLLSLGVQAIPYLAMLRGDMWRGAAP